jgi:hypothetical protein
MSIFDHILNHSWGGGPPPPPVDAFENDISLESAVALYGMTTDLDDESLKQKIQHYYRNELCQNVSNLNQFLVAAKDHPDLIKICLEQAKSSSYDLCPTIAQDLEPEMLLQILQPSSSQQQQQQLSGGHASLLVAACCTAAETCMSLHVFQQLTDAKILPTVDPMAAVFLLALECDYGSISRSLSSTSTMTTSLRSRCIQAIAQDWNHGVEATILDGGDTELIQAWDKIPAEVQAQCMVQAATPIPSSQLLEQQDQEGFFESLPCAQSLVVEDDSDDCHDDDDDDDDSLDSDSFLQQQQQQQQQQPYKGPKCIPSYIPLEVVPRNGRLGARDELFQGYCLYSTTSSSNTSSNGSTTTTDVVNVKPLELQTPASPSLLRSLWETLKLSTSKTNLFQDGISSTASASSEPQHMILYTTKRYCESASSA